MDTKNYFPRIADTELCEQLQASGAVLIEGAKWCGKTRMGMEAAKSALFMQDPDKSESYQGWAQRKPSLLLEGDTPRLIDEWQMAPQLWDAVRYTVDRRGERGQFILTGSAVPYSGATQHSGTGRIARIHLRPMSLFESKESTGQVSLQSLFDGQSDVSGISNMDIPEIATAICRGGWPDAVVNGDPKFRTARNYVDAVVQIDLRRLDNVDRDPQRVRKLLQSYARNISTLATLKTIQADVEAHDAYLGESSLYSYINALRRIFVIEDVPAWRPKLRSKTSIRASEKRQFVDPSIATAIMRVGPERILDDFKYFGFLFESLCTRDLRAYAQSCDGDVYHYHDRNDLEADLIIELADGRWAPIEVKLGSREIEQGASHLMELAEKVSTKPTFMMVVTGGEFAYRRDDGVFVVPIGCLRN